MPISISAVASHSYIFLGATAFVAFAALVAWNIISIRGPPTPKGLRRPPSPPGARFFSGHAHLWSGRVTNNPSQSQLVKWAREYGEIYDFRLGVERWVIVSSPEAVKVGSSLQSRLKHCVEASLRKSSTRMAPSQEVDLHSES